ncbi:MAG: hypothetical protein UHS41_03795 [Lachnospiraceae bacterium]|nr:hypothetical protein [Lachnospiraceae bacterium]
MGFDENGKLEYTNTNEILMEGREVAVLANFSLKGDMRPVFIQLEDDEHQRMRLRIHEIYAIKEEKMAACPLIRYEIGILIQGNMIKNELIYGIELHRWWLRK